MKPKPKPILMPKPKRLEETYYAIRVGNHEQHTPYFMVNGDGLPILFSKRGAAEQSLKKPRIGLKVVKVRLTELYAYE